MKISLEAHAAWKELNDSFEALKQVMDNKATSIMQDQLSRAKVVATDIEELIERLRR